MTFQLNRPVDGALYSYLSTKMNFRWPPFATDGSTRDELIVEISSASYRATQIVPDIQHMLDTFPDLILNGTQDFQIDGDFYRLVITNNEINLLSGHLVYT